MDKGPQVGLTVNFAVNFYNLQLEYDTKKCVAFFLNICPKYKMTYLYHCRHYQEVLYMDHNPNAVRLLKLWVENDIKKPMNKELMPDNLTIFANSSCSCSKLSLILYEELL